MLHPISGLVVDVGGSHVGAAFVDEHRGIVSLESSDTPAVPTTTRLFEQIEHLLDSLKPPVVPEILVIGIPGVVDSGRGVAVYNANLGWHDVPLRSLAEERFHLPVRIENDVRLHALGEWKYGLGRSLPEDAALADVVVGTGVAVGLVVHGKLVNHPEAGELGHITWDGSHVRCGCGKRGCLETIVGAKGLLREFREAGHVADDFARDVVIPLKRRAPEAIRIWERFAAALARGISILAMLLHPDLIVLSGGVAASFPWWNDLLQKSLGAELFPGFTPTFQVVPSALGSRAPYLGGLAVMRSALAPNGS